MSHNEFIIGINTVHQVDPDDNEVSRAAKTTSSSIKPFALNRINRNGVLRVKRWFTRGLLKVPKMAVTEIGHVIDHFHRCQNVPLLFSLLNGDILASATITCPNKCRNAKISHVLGHFGISISIRSRTSR